jgi:hypothetical protein
VLFLSIYLLIWGWLIIKNFSLVPIKLNNVVHNLLVSRTSRSLTMFDGTSMYFNIFRSNNPAITSTVHTVEVVMDTIYLVNLSLTIIHTQNNIIHKKITPIAFLVWIIFVISLSLFGITPYLISTHYISTCLTPFPPPSFVNNKFMIRKLPFFPFLNDLPIMGHKSIIISFISL